MTCLLDVNALMALLGENHEHHPKVRTWFRQVSGFATCPVSQLEISAKVSFSDTERGSVTRSGVICEACCGSQSRAPLLQRSQLGFARVSSHPLLGYGLSPEDAFSVLRQLLADPRHHFIPDDLSCVDRVVRTDLMSGPNQITDRYLVALARQHECCLATLDEPLAKSFQAEATIVHLIR